MPDAIKVNTSIRMFALSIFFKDMLWLYINLSTLKMIRLIIISVKNNVLWSNHDETVSSNPKSKIRKVINRMSTKPYIFDNTFDIFLNITYCSLLLSVLRISSISAFPPLLSTSSAHSSPNLL